MGIRLYPLTPNPLKLERLAAVPQGTAGALAAYQKLEPSHDVIGPDGRKLICAWYDGLLAQPDLNRLHDFYLHGWGRLTPAACQLIDSWGLSLTGGNTTDPDRMAALLAAQGVALPPEVELPSLRWG